MSRRSRKPPKPPHWNVKRGNCRYCGKKTATGRHHWHDKCAAIWTVMNNTREARFAVRQRDKGRCARCKKKVERWDVDHRVPLMAAERDKWGRVPWSWAWLWRLGNLQTLCEPCHKEKTKEDLAKHRLTNDQLTDTLGEPKQRGRIRCRRRTGSARSASASNAT